MTNFCHSPGFLAALTRGAAVLYRPPTSPGPTFVLPKLSRICTSYSPITYTPELEPCGTMNSSSIVQSPNFCSVYRSTPLAALTSSTAEGPAVVVPGTLVTVKARGFFGSSSARPTAHLLFASAPLIFQPARSLPLNGSTGLPFSWAGAAASKAVRRKTSDNLRGMGPPSGSGTAVRGSVPGFYGPRAGRGHPFRPAVHRIPVRLCRPPAQ